MERFLTEWEQIIDRLNYGNLTPDERIDFHLLKNEIEYERRLIERERRKFKEIENLVPFADSIIELEEKRWRVEPLDSRKTAESLEAISASIPRAKKNVEDDLNSSVRKITPAMGLRASNVMGELTRVLETWVRNYQGFDPIFTWWVKKPYEKLEKEMEEYRVFLRTRVAGIQGNENDPMIGEPIGREAILEDLKHEMIPYTPEELIRIGEEQLDWCIREMEKTSKEMGKKDWREGLEHVKTLHVPPGEQDDLVAKQAREAIEFLDRHDLVTIDELCRETWRVDMLSEGGQRFLPFAAYGGQSMLVSYPLDTMEHETKEMSLRGNNIHFTRIVTPHELIPGHHLQGYMAERYKTYRRIFSTPFYWEGWALYWEFLLWDKGYARGPEDKMGMLFWRAHRAARIIISLKYHLGQMTPQEMIDFLVERVGHERFTATGEVRRYISGGYSPLYQCAYMIGGLQLRALYDDIVGKGKMTPKQFHDAVLRENATPIEMLRAALSKIPLPKEYVTSWRFAKRDI